MKKQCLIVLATVVIGLGSLASVQGSNVVVSIPGYTVVQDAQGDLQLRQCNPNPIYQGISCSLPPPAPLSLPGYFDVKTAKIMQLGPKWVELSIALYAPIPAVPPLGIRFIDYF